MRSFICHEPDFEGSLFRHLPLGYAFPWKPVPFEAAAPRTNIPSCLSTPQLSHLKHSSLLFILSHILPGTHPVPSLTYTNRARRVEKPASPPPPPIQPQPQPWQARPGPRTRRPTFGPTSSPSPGVAGASISQTRSSRSSSSARRCRLPLGTSPAGLIPLCASVG